MKEATDSALVPSEVARSRSVFDDAIDPWHSIYVLPELVEAATRCDNDELAADALEQLCERTQAVGTEWALGIEARSRALIAPDSAAEDLYREAIDRLDGCRVAPEQARAAIIAHMDFVEEKLGESVDALGKDQA